MANKAVRAISTSKDMRKLFSIISEMVSKRCWNVEFVYGGELSLHFGRRLPCSHPKLATQFEGEWILGTCGTAWKLFTPDGLISSFERNEKELEQKAKVLENSTVSGIDVGVHGNLTLTFSNNCLFCVLPNSKDDQYADVPYWEIFLPNNMLIAFGPDTRWSLKRSDTPAKQQSSG